MKQRRKEKNPDRCVPHVEPYLLHLCQVAFHTSSLQLNFCLLFSEQPKKVCCQGIGIERGRPIMDGSEVSSKLWLTLLGGCGPFTAVLICLTQQSGFYSFTLQSFCVQGTHKVHVSRYARLCTSSMTRGIPNSASRKEERKNSQCITAKSVKQVTVDIL